MMPGPNNTNDYEIRGAKLKTSVPNKKYKDNYDRIFSNKNNNNKRKGRS